MTGEEHGHGKTPCGHTFWGAITNVQQKETEKAADGGEAGADGEIAPPTEPYMRTFSHIVPRQEESAPAAAEGEDSGSKNGLLSEGAVHAPNEL